MIRLYAIAALVAALAASGLYIRHLIVSEDKARQQAEQALMALEEQAQQAENAMARYVVLDAAFMSLNKRKETIRHEVKTEYKYIQEVARDETVSDYLDDDIPAAINCMLSESCNTH